MDEFEKSSENEINAIDHVDEFTSSSELFDDAISPDQRLENAFDKIETFLDEKLNQLGGASKTNNTDIILANLDILITRVKDMLLQVEHSEN